MKKYLAMLLVAFFILGSASIHANAVNIDGDSKSVTWATEDVIKPTSGEVKTYKPIYKEDKFYYGYWDNNEWVVHDGQKELFRAVDEKAWVFSSVPQYFSYWIKTDNGKKIVLQDVLGNKVPIPDNTAYVNVVQKYTDNIDSFTGEQYFQYWLDDKPGYKDGSGTVIKKDGNALFPIGYYSSLINYDILGEGWFSIRNREDKELLFKEGELIKTVDSINKVYKNRYDLWHIVDNNTDSFINLDTGWSILTKDQVLFRYDTKILLVNDGKYRSELGFNYGDLKIFNLGKDSFVDITPVKEKIVFAAYIFVKDHDTILQKFLVFLEGDKYGKVIAFLKDGTWDKNIEQTTIELPQEKEISIGVFWDVEQNSYRFLGTAMDPQVHVVRFSYILNNKTATENSTVGFKDIDNKDFINKTGGVATGEYYSYYQEYNFNENSSRILSIVILSEKDKSILLEKDDLQDGFVDSGKNSIKFFYQEKNQWSFYDRKEEQEYVLTGMENLFTVDAADLAVYRTEKEQGLFLFYNKEKIVLPKGIDIISLVSGSAKEQTVTLKIKENSIEKIVRFSWQ